MWHENNIQSKFPCDHFQSFPKDVSRKFTPSVEQSLLTWLYWQLPYDRAPPYIRTFFKIKGLCLIALYWENLVECFLKTLFSKKLITFLKPISIILVQNRKRLTFSHYSKEKLHFLSYLQVYLELCQKSVWTF